MQNIPENSNENCPGVDNDNAGKANSCEGCPNQQTCASGELKEKVKSDNAEIQERMKNIKHKILVLSGKGGVGKSTISSQLALGLANMGYEVGLMDLDLCGPSIPRMMGIEEREVHQSVQGWQPVYVDDNLGVMSIGFLLGNKDDAVIWRGPRKNGLIKNFLIDVEWGNLDFLIIDTPPGTSDEHISITQMMQMDQQNDGAIVVTTPQEVSLLDVRKEISFCNKTNTKIIGVVENMSGFICPNCSHESHIFVPTTGGAQKMCKDLNLDLIGNLPLDPFIMMSCDKGKYLGDKESNLKVSENAVKAYDNMINNFLTKLQSKLIEQKTI